MTFVPNLKHLPFGGAESISNPTLEVAVQKMIFRATDDLYNPTIHEDFVNEYKQWISSTKNNTVIGLDAFPILAYSNGTTESFDKFYLKHNTRRFRCFKGEYMYQMACGRNYCSTWSFLDNDPLEENDAVVISFPFSDTGNEHPQMKEVLDTCAILNIPVLLDCAFFGLSSSLVYHLDHPAITEVTFSLSKFFPVANLRIGMRLSKFDDDDTLLISHKHSYVNRIGASVGLKIIQEYTPDYNVEQYSTLQTEFCNQLDLAPSNCVIFGIDNNNKYNEYNRGYISNRLCFSKYFNEAKIPVTI